MSIFNTFIYQLIFLSFQKLILQPLPQSNTKLIFTLLNVSTSTKFVWNGATVVSKKTCK